MQMLFILLLVWKGQNFYLNTLSLSVFMVGVALGVWSVVVMSSAKIRIRPVPVRNTHLVTSGPYKLIRHPMYTAVLTSCFALCLANPVCSQWIFYLSLYSVLLIKLKWEEKMLMLIFPEYINYTKNTYRLIPGVY